MDTERKPKTKVIAVINQKGGVGKTTTTANLGYALGKMGKDVLLIDFDSQASLTNYFGVGLGGEPYFGIYEVLLKHLRDISPQDDEFLAYCSISELLSQAIVRPTYPTIKTEVIDGVKKKVQAEEEFGISLLPSNLELSDYELELSTSGQAGAFKLYDIVQEIIAWHEYDYIFIDCNPTLGIMAINAIAAAVDGVLIPTNLDLMSTRGVERLIDKVVELQEAFERFPNVDIHHMGIIGIVLNLFSDRRSVDVTLQNDLDRFYPFRIFKATIPESVNAKKAVLTGVTYSQMYSKAEKAFQELAVELEERLAEMEKTGPVILKMGDDQFQTTFEDDGKEE